MFDKFVQSKIEAEENIANAIESVTKDSIAKSGLSDFTKNYIFNESNEIPDREQILSKIEKSNRLYLNYTLRPKWTLLTILFNNFESRPPSEIVKKLSLFPFYNYYGDSIRNFISDNFQIFVTKAEVTSIIDRTNKAIYEKLNTEINNAKIKNFFLQLFILKFGEEQNWNLESSIPFSFIKIFLEDKSFTNLLRKFYSIKDLNDETEVSLKDILKILADKYDVQKVEPAPIISIKPEEKKSFPIMPAEQKEVTKPVVDRTEKKEEAASNVVAEKKEEKISSVITEKKKEVIPEKIYSDSLVTASKEEKKSADSNIPEPPSIHDLKDLFDDKQLDKIADKIYNSDLVYMDKSFNKMNHYKTWFEASNHLKEIFSNNRVDIYNKDVISFVDKLSDYYKGRE